jgi:hypothetical protein
MNRAGRIAEEYWSQEFHFVSFSFYRASLSKGCGRASSAEKQLRVNQKQKSVQSKQSARK